MPEPRRVLTLQSWLARERLIEQQWPINVAIREGILDARRRERRPTIRRRDLEPRPPLLIDGREVTQAEYVDHLVKTTIWSLEEVERLLIDGISLQQIEMARVTPILVPR